MSNIGQMIREVAENLAGEGVEQVPSTDRILKALNRAKDEAVALLESNFEFEFIVSATYSVSSGDGSITLPDGSTDATTLNITSPTGTVPAFHRLLGLTRTDNNLDQEAVIIDLRDRHDGAKFAGNLGDRPVLYRQGNTFRFDAEDGAFEAMTLVLRYSAVPADLDNSDNTATYTNYPAAWDDLIVNRATLNLLPGEAASGRSKYSGILRDRIAQMQTYRQRQVSQHVPMIRKAW